MTLRSGSYYLRLNQKWINLGRDRPAAFLKYAEMTAPHSRMNMVSDIINSYLHEETPKKSKGSQANDQQSAKKLIEAFREFRIIDVQPHHIYAYTDHRAKSSPHFANKDRSFLLQCYKLAIKKGIASYNPVKDVSTVSIKPRTRLIAQQEFEDVKSISPPVVQLMMELAYLTKLRRGEMLTLKMADICSDGLKAHDHKNNRDYVIEWTPALRALVLRISTDLGKPQREYLFKPRGGVCYTGDGFASIWQRIMAKAIKTGLIKERFTFHDIRAMAITHTHNTEGLQAASESAGHSDTKITKRVYVRGALRRKATA